MWERRGAAARPETGAVPAEGPSALSRRWERGARRELWPSGPAAQRVGAAVRAGCPRGPGGRALRANAQAWTFTDGPCVVGSGSDPTPGVSASGGNCKAR